MDSTTWLPASKGYDDGYDVIFVEAIHNDEVLRQLKFHLQHAQGRMKKIC